jgi:cholesterol transport system auxiliary component
MRWFSPILLCLALPVLSACGAVSSLSAAGEELDAYTLSPATSLETAAAGGRHLVVELPTAPGALATDRILIKPLPYQAQYLPGSRWSEPTPALVQTLLVASLQNLGGFRLVSRTGAGLMPDHTLMTEVQEFQAEPVATGSGQVTVRVGMMMTIIRESDRRIVASRRFAGAEVVASDAVLDIVGGFDRVVQRVLGEAVVWTVQQAG